MQQQFAAAGVVLATLFGPAAMAAGGTSSDQSRTAKVDAVALYNRGAAVVQDTRRLSLRQGQQRIGWPLVGPLRADTLWLAGDGVRLVGLEVPATKPTQADPLAARIGQPVTLTRKDAGTNTTRRARVTAVHGDVVYVRTTGHILRITASSPWQISWPAPAAERKKGALQLDVDSRSAGRRRVTATYQIAGPTWRVSYTGRFDPASGTLSLQGMAVIDNSGGHRLDTARAWLIAGDVARAGGNGPRPLMMAQTAHAKSSAAGAPQAAGETYRYPLPGGLDLPAGAVRSVALMAPVSFKAKRYYRVENSAYARSNDQPTHARTRLTFNNGADQPLPAGTVRVYSASRAADLMGEDHIGDTPENAPVALELGRSFDVTSRRKLLADTRTAAGDRRREIQLTVHNAGANDAPVEVIEALPGGARIVSATPAQGGKAGADQARWPLKVPAHASRTLRYTVEWSK